jgi:phosphoribosyl 1,2-cyclic phosphodiesterase
MKVTFWGTRGSVASPGPDTVRYGGNTSCVEVRATPRHVVVLDAGTGIRQLGAAIDPDVERVDVLLSHFHVDHVQGLGFFAPLFRPGFDVHIWGPASRHHDLADRLARYLSPPLFPVTLNDLPCHLSLHDVPEAPFALPGLEAVAGRIRHPGRTVGYRLTDATGSIAYLPDHELGFDGPAGSASCQLSAAELVAGVDLLIHDAQYSAAEYREHIGWGHSSITDAIAFAAEARVGRLAAFHHDPAHDDLAIDRLVADAPCSCGSLVDLAAAAEGSVFELPRFVLGSAA